MHPFAISSAAQIYDNLGWHMLPVMVNQSALLA